MKEFMQGYVGAALWSSLDENDEPLDAQYDESDIDAGTLIRMQQDCDAFQHENAVTLSDAYNDVFHDFTPSRAGVCFWLNRNGHGTGFWDETELTPARRKKLDKAAHKFGEYDLYIGDDGKVHGGG